MALPDKKTAAISASGLVGAAALFTAMDARYATAADIEALTESIQMDRIERMETCVEEAERQLRYIQIKPEADRVDSDRQLELEADSRRDRCIRKLERLNDV